MEYRQFGRLNWKGSVLGFGAMRLPVRDDKAADIDEPEAIRMIRYAIDHGVNYVDTAYPYHEGKSEPCVGSALQDGYRARVKLATKLPSWLITAYRDFDRYFGEQLERLQTDCIDFYLLHGLTRNFWPHLRNMGVIKWAEATMAKGRIGHLGFSFHDDVSVFKEIVDAYDNWTFTQIQYNYMDTDYQAGTEGLRYAAAKGLAVVVMEPLRGGQLTREQPPPIASVFAQAPRKRPLAEWALQWLWDQPEVSVVLSGMSAMEHVVENVACAERSGGNTLTSEEQAVIDRVRKAYTGLAPIPCTDCQYCMPCPNGVLIPRIFEMYNEAFMFDDVRVPRFRYRGPTGLKEEQRADKCTACGACEELCPQNIPIAEWLTKAHGLLGPRKK
jgi:uncharacterized protein